jgi:hypothetical protein
LRQQYIKSFGKIQRDFRMAEGGLTQASTIKANMPPTEIPAIAPMLMPVPSDLVLAAFSGKALPREEAEVEEAAAEEESGVETELSVGRTVEVSLERDKEELGVLTEGLISCRDVVEDEDGAVVELMDNVSAS